MGIIGVCNGVLAIYVMNIIVPEAFPNGYFTHYRWHYLCNGGIAFDVMRKEWGPC
jgi:hypothetical protein